MRRIVLAAATWVGTALAGVGASAAPDDRIEASNAQAAAGAVNGNFNIAPENFDRWVFQGSRNIDGAREQLRSHVLLQLDELTRKCGLTESQREKLLLAARADEKRFFDAVEIVRKKFLEVRHDQNAFNAIWQDIQPLQQRQSVGLFGASSFFGKTLRKTLNAEQVTQYGVIDEERRQFRWRAAVDVSLLTLEDAVPLQHAQRERVIELLLERTQPPRAFGQYDHYVVRLRLSQLPERELRPLFDERQWKLLQAQFGQVRGMEQFLVQNGVLEPQDLADHDRAPVRLQPAVSRTEPAYAPADATLPDNRPLPEQHGRRVP